MLRLPDRLNIFGATLAVTMAPLRLQWLVLGGLFLALFSGTYLFFYGRVRSPKVPPYIFAFSTLIALTWAGVVLYTHRMLPAPVLFALFALIAPFAAAPFYRFPPWVQALPFAGLLLGTSLALLLNLENSWYSEEVLWGNMELLPYAWASTFVSLGLVAQRNVKLWVRLALSIPLAITVIWGITAGQPLFFIVLPLILLPLAAKWIGRIPYIIGQLSVWVVLGVGFLFCVSYVAHIADDYFVRRESGAPRIDSVTANGRPYDTLTGVPELQSGYPLWLHVCEEELRTSWAKRSTIPYDSLDKAGEPLRMTLLRYLTSRGHRKDSVGLTLLSKADIASIEAGTYNAALVGRGPIYRRCWRELEGVERHMLRLGGEPTPLVRASVSLRTSWAIIRENPYPNPKRLILLFNPQTPSAAVNLAVVFGWVAVCAIFIFSLGFALYARWVRQAQWAIAFVWMIFLGSIFSPALLTIPAAALVPFLFCLTLYRNFHPSIKRAT